MGCVTGDFLGVGLVGTTSSSVVAGGAARFAGGAADDDDSASALAAADVDAATRCKALPSFLNFVIKFCKCICAEGRVM